MPKLPILVILSCALSLMACGSGSATNTVSRDTARVSSPYDRPFDSADTFIIGDRASLPRHLIDQPITVAIMLPLTGESAPLGQALLNAATMALIDAYDDRLSLIPFDTKGTIEGARDAAHDVTVSDVDVVLGPLFATSISAAGPIINDAGLVLIGFSSDPTVARSGRFVMGFSLHDEITTIISYAESQGHMRFGALLPEGKYGNRVHVIMGDMVEDLSVELTAIETYPPDASAVFEPTERLANYANRKSLMDEELSALRTIQTDMTDAIAKNIEKQEVIGNPDFTAILLPEGGDLLRTIAPLLPFYEVDPAKIQFLGTGLWNDPSLTKEPPLYGGWFAAPDPSPPNDFFARYRDIYKRPAPRITTLAYDAMAMVASLARIPIVEARFSRRTLLTKKGFHGLDGLFRFKANGTIERGLAILQINRGSFEMIKAAPKAFAKF